jgi:hypothetical protein
VVRAADCQRGAPPRPQRRDHPRTHKTVKYLGGNFSPSFRSTISLFSSRFFVAHTTRELSISAAWESTTGERRSGCVAIRRRGTSPHFTMRRAFATCHRWLG